MTRTDAQHSLFKAFSKGQSLIEFVLVAPILLAILVAASLVGLAMYQANMASEAIREPALNKLEMAKQDGPVSSGQLLAMTASGGQGLIPLPDGALDTVKKANLTSNMAVLIGKKVYTPPLGGLLPNLQFTFTVSQGVNKNLLASAGTNPNPPGWLPNSSSTPPWQTLSGQLPQSFTLAGGVCGNPAGTAQSGTALTKAFLDAFAPPTLDYVPRNTAILPGSPVDAGTLAELAKLYEAECSNVANECAAEHDALVPNVVSNTCAASGTGTTCTLVQDNPPGAPGQRVTVSVTTAADGTVTKSPPVFTAIIAATAPLYGDATGQYLSPPPAAQFTAACKKRKVAECQVQKAINRANEIIAGLPQECGG